MELNEEKTEVDKKKSLNDIYSKKIIESRQILLCGEIDEELASSVINKLLVLECASATKPIYMYIDSPGGNAYSGFAIFDMIRFIKPAVKVVGMGLVASAASVVLLGAQKKNRFALPNSRYLIHQPLSEMKGVATDLEIHAKEIERVRCRLNSLISEETGKSREEVFRDTERDCWLNADEALSYGLVSRIVKVRKDLPAK